FVYLVSVYVLDPNLQPVAPPLIRFENGVLGIVGNYFVGLFSAPRRNFGQFLLLARFFASPHFGSISASLPWSWAIRSMIALVARSFMVSASARISLPL